jgi:hypothetical protein
MLLTNTSSVADVLSILNSANCHPLFVAVDFTVAAGAVVVHAAKVQQFAAICVLILLLIHAAVGAAVQDAATYVAFVSNICTSATV